MVCLGVLFISTAVVTVSVSWLIVYCKYGAACQVSGCVNSHNLVLVPRLMLDHLIHKVMTLKRYTN